MEFRTARSHYNTFYMIVLGIIIGTLVGVCVGKVNLHVVLMFFAAMTLPYMLFRVYLSIDIEGQQLIVKSMNFFSRKTDVFSIREVALQLYYIPRVGKSKAFYSMYIIKEGKILHRINHDMKELSVFIDRFNRHKAGI